MAAFLERFWSDLGDSIRDTFAILYSGEAAWSETLALVFSQLLVALVLIGTVGLAYLAIRRLLAWLLRRHDIGAAWAHSGILLLRYLAFLLAALLIMSQFGMTEAQLAAIARAALVAMLFYLAWMLSTGVLLQLLHRYQLDPSVEQLLRNVVAVLIVTFGIVTVLSQFGFDILSIVAGLGIAGLAVGFAAQATIANIIAGVTILIERPFRIGDWVEINGRTGKVMEIALRTTRMRTRDNIFTVIPNASVAEADIINYSAAGPLRMRVPLGIAYKENIARARALLLPLMEQHERVLKEPDMMPAVRLLGLGDSSVDLALQFWVASDDIDIRNRIGAELLEQAKEALDAAGIEIPFPHLQLFIDDASGLQPVLEPLYPRGQAVSRGRNS